MHSQIINEMLEALAPTIRNQKKARVLLERYWSDKIAIIWTTEDVHRAANEIKLVLTEPQARDLLQDLSQHHNRQYGLRWSDLTDILEDKVLGRKITPNELTRFVHNDIITIAKEAKPKRRRIG